MTPSEIRGVIKAGWISGEKRIDILTFATKAGEDRQIDV